MIHTILTAVASFIINTISAWGLGGVVALMAIESANIPLPSEVIMPFSGYVASAGRFSVFEAAVAGGLGCLIGSLFSYWLGAVGGRPLVEKYGKYILISHHDLDTADRWFQKYGAEAAFFGRLLPVVRTFISFPAGIARTNLVKFSIYTFVGSVIWSYVLALIGFKLGENWELIRGYFRGADIIIAILIVAGIAFWIYRHVRNSKK